jgi:hypothetical protein
MGNTLNLKLNTSILISWISISKFDFKWPLATSLQKPQARTDYKGVTITKCFMRLQKFLNK